MYGRAKHFFFFFWSLAINQKRNNNIEETKCTIRQITNLYNCIYMFWTYAIYSILYQYSRINLSLNDYDTAYIRAKSVSYNIVIGGTN